MTVNHTSAAARLSEKKIPIIFLAGPTAVGKTALAIEIARRFDGEIISVDSMQVYRGMDIGTAKPTAAEQAMARHHLIDIVDPDEEYNLARFIVDAERVCNDLAERGKLPVFAGGTGLYMRGFINGIFELDPELAPEISRARKQLKEELAREGEDALFRRLVKVDPVSAARLHPHDTVRVMRALEIYTASGIPWSRHLAEAGKNRGPVGENVLKIGLSCDREKLYQRIDSRVDHMLAHGFRAEVEGLLAAGFSPELKSMQSIGYQHMVSHLLHGIDLATTRDTMARDTRRYAKRQLTWFGREEGMVWHDPGDLEAIIPLIADFIKGYLSRNI